MEASPVVFAGDAWLSGLLGKPCHVLSSGRGTVTPGDLPPGPCLVWTSLGAERRDALARLRSVGFRVVATTLTLAREAAPLDPGPLRVRFARPGDEDRVRAVARHGFAHDRFHADPLIGDEAAGRIKEAWAANFFTGKRGDWMVVSEREGRVEGFLQLLATQDATVVIDLVGVDGPSRGLGAARSMIAFAARSCRGAWSPLRVGTQRGNTPAMRLYEGLGFRLVSASYSLHLHRRGGQA